MKIGGDENKGWGGLFTISIKRPPPFLFVRPEDEGFEGGPDDDGKFGGFGKKGKNRVRKAEANLMHNVKMRCLKTRFVYKLLQSSCWSLWAVT